MQVQSAKQIQRFLRVFTAVGRLVFDQYVRTPKAEAPLDYICENISLRPIFGGNRAATRMSSNRFPQMPGGMSDPS
jgi:hypothetical protein